MASDPCLEERNAVEAQLAIVSTLMADLGMQIAELDSRIQILENCEFENQPMLSDETQEEAICRLTNHRQHLIGLCELLRKDVIAMQAKCEAMQKILKGQ